MVSPDLRGMQVERLSAAGAATVIAAAPCSDGAAPCCTVMPVAVPGMALHAGVGRKVRDEGVPSCQSWFGSVRAAAPCRSMLLPGAPAHAPSCQCGHWCAAGGRKPRNAAVPSGAPYCARLRLRRGRHGISTVHR